MKNYFKLLKFLSGHRSLFIVAVMLMMIAGALEVFSISSMVPLIDIVFTGREIIIPNNLPQFVKDFIGQINGMDRRVLMPRLLMVVTCAMILKNILIYGFQHLMSDVAQRVMRDVRYQLYDKIQGLSLDYFSKKRTGELMSRITHDTGMVENAVSYGLTDLFRQSFVIIFWVSTAFALDPMAALIIFGIFPLIGIPMANIGKRLKKISRGIQEKIADINTLLLETISGIKLVHAYCMEDEERKRFEGENTTYYKLKMKAVKRLIVIGPMTELIGWTCAVGLIMWNSRRMWEGEISFGVFGLFLGSIMQIISPIKKLGNVNALTQQGLSASERIYDILEAPITIQEKTQAKELPVFKDKISLENINFSYNEENEIVLSDINVDVPKGKMLAIVGPTGTGKSTLVNLIPRFYDPNQGRVTFDGIDVKEANLKSLRGQIGIVTQEVILFNDTVMSNIMYGTKGKTKAEVEEAAKKAFAHRFIEKMPQGYNTLIGDRGFRLSGGERQRIAIARAILRNAPILILDEATSALDSESESYVQEALNELMKGRTVIAIAHRLSTIQKADKIIVLKKGRIIGSGPHEELLKTCDLYKKLHNMQFQI